MSKQAKKIDLKKLYRLIYERASITKPELADHLDISLTAISGAVNRLQELGMVEASEKQPSQGGRPAYIYRPTLTRYFIVGIDIRARHFYLFVADLNGTGLSSAIYPQETAEYQEYIQSLVRALDSTLIQQGIEPAKVLAVGISVSGTTDVANRIIDRSNEFDWTNQPLASDLEAHLGIPVFVETEVRIYARNELAWNDADNTAAVLYMNEGIGLALIVHNQVFRGYTNRAGDNRFFGAGIKEMYRVLRSDPLVKEINDQPYYSALTSLEQVAALNDQFQEYASRPEIRQQLDDFCDQIARLMVSLAKMLNPKTVLLTGNVFDYNDHIFRQVKNSIMTADELFHTPVVKRNAPGSGSLERGIVRFVMEKYFHLAEFRI